ncbi:MAG: hypothetical protein HXY50_11675 [Ignavibacteriaceae bacterium]|nr:hypothetical protein [Ignavibacteriaceae bacterium]
MSKLVFSQKGCYYKTNTTLDGSPMVLSQARVILILCNQPFKCEPKFQSIFLIKQMTDYLISMRDAQSLYKFNQASWDLQDEGIASVWATMALIKSFEITNNQKYIEAASLTMQAMLSHLYTKETSLIHTKGDTFWTLDAASTFAYVCSLFLEHRFNEDLRTAMNDSISLCINNISTNGHFPYHENRDTYLFLYHPIIMVTLEKCLNSKYVDPQIKQKLKNTITKATNFLVESFDKNNRIFEPVVQRYQQYLISQVTALYSLKGKNFSVLEESLLRNIASFAKNEKLYLCKDNRNKLFNSDTYITLDVFLVEVLFWLDLYFNE